MLPVKQTSVSWSTGNQRDSVWDVLDFSCCCDGSQVRRMTYVRVALSLSFVLLLLLRLARFPCPLLPWSELIELKTRFFFWFRIPFFMIPRTVIASLRAWFLVIYIWNGTCAKKAKTTKCCKGLRNDLRDAWPNSQKQRDRYSGRDLV